MMNDNIERDTKLEKKIRWVYNWLLWSPILTVPWMFINMMNLSFRSSAASWIWAALVPASVHIILISSARSENLYVKRHAQQAMYLVLLRALTTVIFIGFSKGSGAFLWFMVNGILWLWGSSWGKKQIANGDSWLMRFEGEGHLLPRPWAIAEEGEITAPVQPENIRPTTPGKKPSIDVSSLSPASMHVQKAMEKGNKHIFNMESEQAIPELMLVFREGPEDWRTLAIKKLKNLGQIDTF